MFAGFSLVYHKYGINGHPAWDKAYYVWLCTVHLIALITISADDKKLFYQICPLTCYAMVRLVIEVATIYEPMEAVNDPVIVDILLHLCAAATALLVMKDAISEWFYKNG